MPVRSLHFHATACVCFLTGFLLLALPSRAFSGLTAESLAQLLHRAHAGDAEAQYRLGLLYRFAPLPEHDIHESTRWFRAAANQGHPAAMAGAFYAQDYGYGGEISAQAALKEAEGYSRRIDASGSDAALDAFHLDLASWFFEAQTRAAKWFAQAKIDGADRDEAVRDINRFEAAYRAIELAGPPFPLMVLRGFSLNAFYQGCDRLGIRTANWARHERWQAYNRELAQGANASTSQLGMTKENAADPRWRQSPRAKLSALLVGTGRFAPADMDMARELLRQARQDGLPHGSIAEAAALLMMGQQAAGLGRFGEALAYVDRALPVFKKERLVASTGQALGLKGYIFYATGQYKKAAEADAEALKSRESRLDPEIDPQQPMLLGALGELALLNGRPAEAEQQYRRMFDLASVRYGEFGLMPKILSQGGFAGAQFVQLPAEAQLGLARSFAASGRRAEARRLFERVLSILDGFPTLGGALAGRAYIYAAQFALDEGRDGDALRLAQKFLSLAPATDPLFLPWRAEAQDVASRALELQANLPGALEAAAEADAIRTRLLSFIMTLPDETMRLEALAKARKGLARVAELAMRPSAGPEERRAELLYDAWMGRKALNFDAQLAVQRRLERSASGEARSVARELAQVRGELARNAFSPARLDMNDETQRSAELESQRQELVLRQASLTTGGTASEDAPVRAVALPLPDDALLLDVMRLAEGPAPGYYAFLVRKGGPVRLVKLGDIEAMEAAARKWLALAGGEKNPGQEDIRSGAAAAFRALLGPVGDDLAGAKRLYLVPDGLFHLLPVDTLMDGDVFLAERLTIRHLTSARELLRAEGNPATGEPLVLADPAFAMSLAKRIATPATADVERSRGGRSMTLMFPALPGTGREARAVAEALGGGARVLTGRYATKTALLSLAQPPRELHIATHAFYLGGGDNARPTPIAETLRGLVVENTPARVSIRIAVDRLGSPMLRSGLVFAGVGGPEGPGVAILTAEEAMGLSLAGTRLVTLSACQTGLGEIAQGDEVYGLRRAFRLAGAEHLVASLWRVPDDATARLMTDFYQAYGRGVPVEDALAEAKRKAIASVREKGRLASPRDWGGFIAY